MKIQPYGPRSFLPDSIDLTSTDALAPIFERLDSELKAASTVEALITWLDHASEVSAALSQSQALTYIERTCDTEDPEKEKAYLKIIEEVEPWLKPKQFALTQHLANHPCFKQLPKTYQIYQRSIATEVRLYRENNVAREVEEAKQNTTYDKIIGTMTVSFDGQEQTLPQMQRVQEETDRSRREKAWKLVVARRLQDQEVLETLFDRLLELRQAIAHEADFDNYRDYIFSKYERFDYSPDDCLQFHHTIEKHVVPLARQLQQKRQERLGVSSLRPWDLAVDPQGLPPLHPFEKSEELIRKCDTIFQTMDPRFAHAFSLLQKHECLDLDNRKGKAPGGYQHTLSEARLPFIFMNAVGVHRDLETLVHEAGHAFHAVASRDQPLHAYRHAPIEFCEVASMGMELMSADFWQAFYQEKDVQRARQDHLKGIIQFFPWMAIIDAFQHWLYTHPGHSREERKETWLDLLDRFGGIEDWSGYEEARAYLWHRQPHLFEVPFYYVEYGIAQLGALQLWQHWKKNKQTATDAYWQGLTLGGSRTLPELFQAAGLQFDFSDATLLPLMQAIQKVLGPQELSTPEMA